MLTYKSNTFLFCQFTTKENPFKPMDQKTPIPPKPPFSLGDLDPHLIHQCLGQPHSPPQTAGRSLRELSHDYATKSTLVIMERPTFTPKIVPVYLPHPWTQPTHHSRRHPEPISRFSTMQQTDRQTDTHTDGQMVQGTKSLSYQYPLTHY